ncbi:hypothetical protein KPH14_010821 [Odynerus spinipes]|uniref:Uncharacterized protein n=1 Tax=Odynerus spinipes TaxID=1348599 RepID=A0AAD9RGY4_9HYME|nr:hypothetical protein KPH14_010821 [Odynerus spinipes]
MAACSCPVHSARVTGAATNRRRRSSIEDTTRTRRAFPVSPTSSTSSTSSKVARETERCTTTTTIRVPTPSTRRTRL